MLLPSDTMIIKLSAWHCVLWDTIVGSSRLNPMGRSSGMNVCLSWWTSFEEKLKQSGFSGIPFYWSGFYCGLPHKEALSLGNWVQAGEILPSLGQHHLSCVLAGVFDFFQNLKSVCGGGVPPFWGVATGSIGLCYWKDAISACSLLLVGTG